MVFNPPTTENVCDKCGGELYQRSDDTLETAKNRLKVYNDQTQPLIEYYRGKGLLREINGDQEIAKVLQDIVEALENNA
jgi:adenylate kinase